MLRTIALNVRESVLRDFGVAPARPESTAMDPLQPYAPIAIMVDATSDSSNTEQCIIYARVLAEGRVVTHFLGIKPLRNGDADSYLNVIWEQVDELKIERKRIFWLGTDGASTMIGEKAGLGALMKRVVPFMLTNHCVDHRYAQYVTPCLMSCACDVDWRSEPAIRQRVFLIFLIISKMTFALLPSSLMTVLLVTPICGKCSRRYKIKNTSCALSLIRVGSVTEDLLLLCWLRSLLCSSF